MEIIIIVLITILGLILGSFYGCMGYRIPNKISVTASRSFCNECGKTLKWYMNIPVFSYIFLKGRCHYCKKPIDFVYPFVEITCALLFLCNYLMFGFTLNFFIATILTSILMVTIVSDFLYYYISDRVLVLGGISLIVVLSIFLDMSLVFSRIINGAILFMLLLGIKILGNYMFKKESLGDGDIKLMGVIGIALRSSELGFYNIILGTMSSFVALFIASIIGLIFSVIIHKKNKEGIIPFGPFLLIGALIVLYFEPIIMPFIKNIINI
ncbi:MAG: hypothetical protein GX758_01775 [Tenericutes bacterium]|nr:hypothetical protein [Mycoplasmatota bacterium]